MLHAIGKGGTWRSVKGKTDGVPDQGDGLCGDRGNWRCGRACRQPAGLSATIYGASLKSQAPRYGWGRAVLAGRHLCLEGTIFQWQETDSKHTDHFRCDGESVRKTEPVVG